MELYGHDRRVTFQKKNTVSPFYLPGCLDLYWVPYRHRKGAHCLPQLWLPFFDSADTSKPLSEPPTSHQLKLFIRTARVTAGFQKPSRCDYSLVVIYRWSSSSVLTGIIIRATSCHQVQIHKIFRATVRGVAHSQIKSWQKWWMLAKLSITREVTDPAPSFARGCKTRLAILSSFHHFFLLT